MAFQLKIISLILPSALSNFPFLKYCPSPLPLPLPYFPLCSRPLSSLSFLLTLSHVLRSFQAIFGLLLLLLQLLVAVIVVMVLLILCMVMVILHFCAPELHWPVRHVSFHRTHSLLLSLHLVMIPLPPFLCPFSLTSATCKGHGPRAASVKVRSDGGAVGGREVGSVGGRDAHIVHHITSRKRRRRTGRLMSRKESRNRRRLTG